MQKTFATDFLTGRREKNTGQLDSYLVEDAHEPIIDQETFARVQRMKGNIKKRQEMRQIEKPVRKMALE